MLYEFISDICTRWCQDMHFHAVLLARRNTLHAAGRCAAMTSNEVRAHRLRLVSGAPLRSCCQPLTACRAAKAGVKA